MQKAGTEKQTRHKTPLAGLSSGPKRLTMSGAVFKPCRRPLRPGMHALAQFLKFQLNYLRHEMAQFYRLYCLAFNILTD